MTWDDLGAAVTRAEREVFRLEVQQSYAGVDDPGWEAWRACRPLPKRTVENDAWLAELASSVAAGRRRYRVLVIDRPLTEYRRYELTAFADNAAAGEEVFVVQREVDHRLTDLTEDFWMVDDRLVAIMPYDREHRPLEPVEPTEPVAMYITQRNLAMKHSAPLHKWAIDHQGLLAG